MEDGGLDAIIFNASGCGVALKDYEHLLRDDPGGRTRGPVSALCHYVSKCWWTLASAGGRRDRASGNYHHLACTMQHGLGLRTTKALLAQVGFTVREPAEAHLLRLGRLYSILQPDISDKLRRRKLAHIDATQPQIVASGNIACITHLAAATNLPVVHTVELLDWATEPEPQPWAEMCRS